ncbi:MAG: hypothetical protein AB1540_10760 [Bdellovibrionota bacterium]
MKAKAKKPSSEKVFERQKWGTEDIVIQEWVNSVVWKALAGPSTTAELPRLQNITPETAEVLRQVLFQNRLHGLVVTVFGKALEPILGQGFYEQVEVARRRNEIISQEMSWLFGPQLGSAVILIGDSQARPLYERWGAGASNPRMVQELTLWTPTLSARDSITKILETSGYSSRDKNEGYRFAKVTMGVEHSVQLHGVLWESAKNWSTDVERSMWDRATASSQIPGALQLDRTDLLLMSIRRFAIEGLLGSAIHLLDLVMVLDQERGNLDWARLKQIQGLFAKPDWFWAALMAAMVFERTTGLAFDLPEWVRTKIESLSDSFWPTFIESRLNWANPDARFIDFSRAYVKLAKGT